MKSSFLFRSRILLFFILLFVVLLLAKLFLIQVISSNVYSEAANRQYYTLSQNVFERKTIYFSRKDGTLVSAATQTPGYKLAIAPNELVNVEDAYKKLSAKVTLKQDDFFAKAGKKDDPYEEVANHLSESEAKAISLLKIPGVKIVPEKWRLYPGDQLASHTIGLVGYKGDELAGRYGLERQYNEELALSKNNPYVNFFAEVFSNISKNLFSDETKNGDVVTTIEPTVQDFLEKKLSQVKEKYRVDSVGGIIMNPADGSIYALSAKPDFNPNDFSGVKQTSTFSNPLVENVQEFGSVVKPLVMAAALDAGVLTAKTTYNDRGSVIVEKKEIFNFDKKGRGPGTSMQEVLSQSLNTGMVFVEQKLGKEKLREYLLSYGIKNKTGVDLPNETSGLVSNLNSPREIEYANAAFGQGIALTPVGLIRALSALANGGNLVVPHVVKKVNYIDGTSKEMTYPTTRAKITKETGEAITRMLVVVMDKVIKGGA